MADWRKFIASSDSPYEFQLNTPIGAEFRVPPPYPDLIVEQSVHVGVNRLVWHVVAVKAEDAARDKKEQHRFGRLVAVLEGGSEIELYRAPWDDEIDEPPIDMTRCGACRGNIPDGAALLLSGVAYHVRCVMTDGED